MAWTSAGIVEVAIKGRYNAAEDFVTVLHAAYGVNSPEDAARDILNNWQDHMVGQWFPNLYLLVGAEWRDRDTVAGDTGFLAPDPLKPIVGFQSGDRNPPNVATLIHKHISAAVGKRKGRMFGPPLLDVAVDSTGTITTAVQASINANLLSFYQGVDDASGAQLVVVHGTAQDFGAKDASIVTGLTLDSRVSTQRRRLR